MKLVRKSQLRELLVKSLVGFLESITILLAAVEVNLDSGFLYRGGVRLGNEHRIDGFEKLFVGRIAKDLADQLHHELRSPIPSRRMRKLGKQRSAVSRDARKHLGMLECQKHRSPTAHRYPLNRSIGRLIHDAIGLLDVRDQVLDDRVFILSSVLGVQIKTILTR